MTLHENFQDVSGVSLTTGTQYHLTTNVNQELNFTSGALDITVAQNMNLVSQGAAPNYDVQSLLHITINADGSLAVDHSQFRVSC